MRVALIYAILDCSSVISRLHLDAALEVWRYCEESAACIYGDALGDRVADTILSALRQRGTEGMSRTEITALLGRNRSAAQIDRALDLLQKCGRVRSDITSAARGPKTTRYYAITATAPAPGSHHA
jgi:hypothetical protein